MFNRYMDNGPITTSRKFYFHTDDGRLNRLFVKLQEQGIQATIFPLR
jgi:hypothetical protein